MSSRLRGGRIALAVADEAFRETLRRTLAREGAVLSASALGSVLLQAIGSFDPHACILDVDLPDTGPEELVATIRRTHPSLPIVLVSAHLFPGDVPALRDLPTLPLPFSRVQLLEVLERSLRGRAA